jgi:hypothetical protein
LRSGLTEGEIAGLSGLLSRLAANVAGGPVHAQPTAARDRQR